jgi:hypothetical protein
MDSPEPNEGREQTRPYAVENGGKPLFFALRDPQPGTVELRRCYSPRSGDHMLSIDARNECPRAGYQVEGVLGYVYPMTVANAVEVHRCWNRSDHLTARDPQECLVNRYQVEASFWAF